MQRTQQLTFGPFRLDPANERLWHGAEAIPLRPKAFAVLRLLAAHPGQLVTKQQLLDTVWPATFVSDAVLKGNIRQLRDALGDVAATPQYIETAHRRGYRFIAQITNGAVGEASSQDTLGDGPAFPPPRRAVVSSAAAAPASVLGREEDLARLRDRMERALAGDRQVVFVTGEPGIGKTTLVNALLQEVAAVQNMWIARGQCLEQYGAGEAYLPVLEGLARLGRAPDGGRIVDLLRQHAPAWLLELPSLLPPVEREALRQQTAGASREAMLREMAEAIEAMTAECPLVLVLEDLHWSDYSTVDLLAYLARRPDPARLMVIGTYRPVDVILRDHPLKAIKRELQAHGLCQELPLEYLTEDAVAQYLAVRFSTRQLSKRLTRLVHQRSEGNPLFMVNLVEYLIQERVIVLDDGVWQLRGFAEIESGVPDGIRQLIEKQIERLSPDERRVLEGASVVGMQCSSVAIAAGLDESTEWVEERCEALVRRYQFLTPGRLVELPDGTITPRYKFSHVLYLEVPYSLLPPMLCAQIHRRIGHSGEAIYRDRVGEIAAELAMHFEVGLDNPRAVKYLLQAAANATHRSANHEAEGLARRGLRALQTLPPSAERDQQELSLRLILGVAVMAIKGFAAAEVKAQYESALELCRSQPASSQVFRVQWLLGLFHYFRAEMQSADKIVHQLLELANSLDDSALLLEAHRATGAAFVDLGRFREALEHCDQVSALYDSTRHRSYVSFAGQDPKVVSECFAARALWALGDPDAALERVERAVSLARDTSHAESLLIATHFNAHLHQLRGEPSATQARAETVIALADEYGLALWLSFGHMNRGWARLEQGEVEDGIAELRQGLATYAASGARLWRPYYLGLLAQALAKAGRVEEALDEIGTATALIQETGERWCAAELHRVTGELLLARAVGKGAGSASKLPSRLPPDAATQAESCFKHALAIAREQHAGSWVARARASLNRPHHR